MPVRVAVYEIETQRVRQIMRVPDGDYFRFTTPPDWPPCDWCVVPEDFAHDRITEEDRTMSERYFIVYNREGQVMGPYAVKTQTDYDAQFAGRHYPMGFLKHPITYAQAEQLAFDGQERWQIDPDTKALIRKV